LAQSGWFLILAVGLFVTLALLVVVITNAVNLWRATRTANPASPPSLARITRRELGDVCHILANGRLVAALVQEINERGEKTGRWVVEIEFDAFEGPYHPTFADLDEAQAGVERHLRKIH
jgi:cytochrome c biogenesis protein ResB